MALKNRNKNEPGRLRVQITCPVCGSACIVRTSNQMSDRLREHNIGCTDPLCGWTGVAHTEIVRTISPPSAKYKDVQPPPLVDDSYFDAHHDETTLI